MRYGITKTNRTYREILTLLMITIASKTTRMIFSLTEGILIGVVSDVETNIFVESGILSVR